MSRRPVLFALFVAVFAASFVALPGPRAGQSFVKEVEPNGTAGTATSLGATAPVNVVAMGSIQPNQDVDYWSFPATAGDRVFAATQTAFSASLSFDTVMELLASDGTTLIESDDNDGSFATSSSSIAGAVIPSSGTYYLRISYPGTLGIQIRPYFLHVRTQRGAPAAEVEPNNTGATATALPASGYVSGVHAAADQDWFRISLSAGDTVFLSLDADPERNNITWNPRLGFGMFGDAGDQLITVDDANTAAPNSEASFVTVKSAGTYYVVVDSAASPGGSTETYRLSVSVHPAAASAGPCTTYSATDLPQPIPDGGLVRSFLRVPGHPRIADLDVSIQLNHTAMKQIDAALRSPAGNENSIFTNVGSPAAGVQTQMDLTLDDEAAIPIFSTSAPSLTAMKGLVYQPELQYRLGWFDGEDAGGTWSLDLRDDTIDGNVGALTGWSITVCEPAPAPICAGTLVTVYSNDFESGDGGFAHFGGGGPDDWARGLPSGDSAPILSCNSGTSCWKTNLTGWYSDGSDQQLVSPAISLAGVTTPITAQWAMMYQMESANYDSFTVQSREVGGANPRTLFQYMDSTMDDLVGVGDAEYLNESAGWGLFTADLGGYAGKNIELAYRLTSDNYVGYSGLAVDDVTVTACCTTASCADTDPCTKDICDPARGCVHAPACDDSNPCTIDSCNPSTGECSHTPLTGIVCNDGNPCTTGDTCKAGACVGVPEPAPPEVGDSLRVTKSPADLATISWIEPPGNFNAYRGYRSGTGAWFYNLSCQTAGTSGPALDYAVPSGAGDAFYYLVTRRTTCGESIAGRDSAGNPVPNPNPCP